MVPYIQKLIVLIVDCHVEEVQQIKFSQTQSIVDASTIEMWLVA